jgi:anti-sigma factor RsiW
MKCEQAESWILLADSGELAPADKRDLEAHLFACDNCRNYRESVSKIVNNAGEYLPTDGPGYAVLTSIRAAAAEHVDRKNQVLFMHPAVRAFAAAAAILLVVSAWFQFAQQKQAPARNRVAMIVSAKPEQIGHINTIMSLLSGQEADEQQQGGATRNQDVNRLAREILIMEGLSTESDYEQETAAPDGESLPTDPRSSSTFEPGLTGRV